MAYNQKKLRDNLEIVDFVLITFFLLLTFYYSYFSIIHTDETWNIFEAKLISEGLKPYKDFFLHRLPLTTYLNSLVIQTFGEKLIYLRITASIISFLTFMVFYMYFLIHLKKRISKLLVFSLLLIPIFFWSQNIIATYAYGNFLILLSFIFLENFEKNIKSKFIIFLILNFFIIFNRYIIDVHIIYCFISIIFIVIKFPKFKKFLITSSFLFFISIILVFLNFDKNIFFSTIEYNFSQASFLSEEVQNKNLIQNIKNFIFLRKLEFSSYIILILLFLISLWKFFSKVYVFKLTRFNFKKIEIIDIILLIFIFGYYLFYILTLSDYPITKSYLIFPSLIFIIRNFKICKLENKILYPILIVSLLINFNNFQNIKFSKKNRLSNFEKVDVRNIQQYLETNDNIVFTLNPILGFYFNIDQNYSMELYSLLHNLSPENANKFHLGHYENLISNIVDKKYDLLIINDERLFGNKNMSKILSNEKKNKIREVINRNYIFVGKIDSVYRDNYDLWKKLKN